MFRLIRFVTAEAHLYLANMDKFRKCWVEL